MNKIKKLCMVPLGVLFLGNFSEASMLDQVIYNVVGQASNAAGARLGDEIYYGSSRGGSHKVRKHRKKHRAKKKKHIATPVNTPEMKIQRALTSLGFYRGKIDGEINSFETRSAIKALNIAYGISNSASLLPQEKDSLLFLGTLFNFDRNLIVRGSDKKTKGRKIQTALKVLGFYTSKIDGAVGPGTRKCIAEYKASAGQSYGQTLDFEEEYQLVNSAKEMNDKNIEDTINSLKALGTQQSAPIPAPVAYKVQQPAAPQAYQPRQAVSGQPVQNVQVQPSVQVAVSAKTQAAMQATSTVQTNMPDASTTNSKAQQPAAPQVYQSRQAVSGQPVQIVQAQPSVQVAVPAQTQTTIEAKPSMPDTSKTKMYTDQ